MSVEAGSLASEARRVVAGLDGPVDVFRDEWGIPHLRAGSKHDAYFAQGYVHAQDRLWQMQAALRRMQGRWAEWAGPSGVAADALARRLGVMAASERDYAALKPESRAMLDAYGAGVNAYLAEGHPLPFEYSLHGDGPETWRPWDAIAVMRQRGYLMGSVWFKLWRAAALPIVGPDEVGKLRYDDGGADRLCIPPGADAERFTASLADLAPALAALSELGEAEQTGGGSNNWAIAPSRTATGRPLVAGDPHRVFEMPGMYAQMHLGCPDFDAIGLTVPGVPGYPHFAHNGHVAWCVTHAFVDIHDLYVERFRDGGATYEFRGEQRATTRRRETIAVRGADPVTIEIVETHHGPVVAGDPACGSAVTLRSVQFAETDLSFDCLDPMLSARTVDGLFEATRGWGLIDHNLVAGDTSGRIGHLVRGLVPVRPRLNGWLPVPGWTGEYEWSGTVPYDRMPKVFDPPRGYLATANNRVVADTSPDYLCTDCHPPYRAKRIEALLAKLPTARVEDMPAIHADTLSQNAIAFRDAIARLEPDDAGARGLRDLIVAWDGRMSPDSRAAAAYAATRWELAGLAAERSRLADAPKNRLLQVPPPVSPVLQVWWALPHFLRDDDASLFGDLGWPQALAIALARATPVVHGRTWGELHRTHLAHPLAPLFPEAASVLDPPGSPVGGDNDTVLANGAYPATALRASYGAVARYVFDVGNWEACRWIVFGGSSGDPRSAHYADQQPVWARTEMVPMLYDWVRIAEVGRIERLVPTDRS